MKRERLGLLFFFTICVGGFFYYQSHHGGPSWRRQDFVRFNLQHPLMNDRLAPADEAFSGKSLSGLKVLELGEESLLKKIGFQTEDFISNVNMATPKDVNGFEKNLGEFLKGRGIYIEYYRRGEKKTFAAVLL